MDWKFTPMRMCPFDVGRSVLQCAIEQDRVELTEMLLKKGADVNFADDYRNTPLLAAAKSRKASKLIPLLLKYGADVTARDIDGRNVLHWLVRAKVQLVGLADLVGALISKGASLNDRISETHYQPLHEAVHHGNIELVKVLLEHGADVNDAQAEYGKFPLYIATMRYVSVPLVEILLKHGANVNMAATNGQTALHPTCENPFLHCKRKIIRELLLSAGADCCVKDHNGNTAFALLSQNLPWICRNCIPHPDLIPFIKAVALKSVSLSASIELKDEMVVKENPEILKFYQECIRLVFKAKTTMIIENFSFLDLLTKCRCQIAALIPNEQFVSQFRMHDLEASFDMYSFDINEAFKRAKDYYNEMLEQENVINEAVYNILPYLIVRKVVGNIFHCKMRKCVLNRKQ